MLHEDKERHVSIVKLVNHVDLGIVSSSFSSRLEPKVESTITLGGNFMTSFVNVLHCLIS